MHVRPRTFLCGTSKGGDAEGIYDDNAQLNDSARLYSCTYARMIEHVANCLNVCVYAEGMRARQIHGRCMLTQLCNLCLE